MHINSPYFSLSRIILPFFQILEVGFKVNVQSPHLWISSGHIEICTRKKAMTAGSPPGVTPTRKFAKSKAYKKGNLRDFS